MIQITNDKVFGWESAVRGMRNPLNSWDLSDTCYFEHSFVLKIGEKDLDLMKRLVRAGTDHSKFMRMINVSCDIVAPLYWWKEADTYKVGTVANSCSTMHKIHAKEFEPEDFSIEHLSGMRLDTMMEVIEMLNHARSCYLYCTATDPKDRIDDPKDWWWQMIQLLPTSYNQRRTVQMNYAVLRNIYHARKNHKLDEWRNFCRWIERLPHSELITMETKHE